MAALVGNLTSIWNPFHRNLLFARQPEPDLEFTEEELDQTASTNATAPPPPRKKLGGGRPILWLLLLVTGGIAYVATMEPERLTKWLSPSPVEQTPPAVATKPKPLFPAPAPQATPSPNDTVPIPAPAAPAASTAVVPAAPAVTALQATPPPAPLFGEGQKVTVTADPNAPGGNILLHADSTGSKPGPFVRVGATMTVLDGDLQPDGWVYSVRTDEGTKGWVPEKRLRVKH
ncbi:MAG: hypothetical protein NTX84_03815 [Nitrospirae bacterium]|nr:hypothetical protein [Nitrospirota bacterium]